MRSFKSNENIHKKEGGSYYVVRFNDIDIGEEWFGIANGLNSFINNRVWPLIDVKVCFVSVSSEQMDEF